MYMYTQGHSRIISTGAYIPDKRITSREILQAINSETRFGISMIGSNGQWALVKGGSPPTICFLRYGDPRSA